MVFTLLRPLALALVAGAALVQAAPAEIKLLGHTTIPGDASDKSGLTDEKLEDGSPQNRLGGFGSGIAYTGTGNRYVMIPDRGPLDGAVSYKCRLQFFDITLEQGKLQANLVETVLLTDSTGESFVGLARALDKTKDGSPRRLDPESVRVGKTGTFFVSDEYGPVVYEFNRQGRLLRSLNVPERFRVPNPGADEKAEAQNKRGRAPNRGFESLAITPDGSKLYALLQSSLLQDGGRNSRNVRLLEMDVAGGATREFVYRRANLETGMTELLAINASQFLVLERDAKGRFCKLMKMDLQGATDITGIEQLPADELPAGVVAARSSVFLDLLDPRFGLAGPDFPRKVEGITFGPDLPDGRHLLLVSSDNDFDPAHPSHLFAFAIDPADLPNLQLQRFER